MRGLIRAGIVAAALLGAATLNAQVEITPPRPQEGWTKARIAKWTLLGAAIGFGSYALVESGRAEDYYGQLRRQCQTEPQACQLLDGRYADPEAERLYENAAAADRRARVGIIGGQVTLLGSAAFFVYDLRNGRGPDDIPYPPSRAQVGVGLRLKF
jgi:hypothetical protein